jgi:serine/threonine protein kinase
MVVLGGVVEAVAFLYLLRNAREYFQAHTTLAPISMTTTATPCAPSFTPSFSLWRDEYFEIFPGHLFQVPKDRVRKTLTEILGQTQTSTVFAIDSEWAVKYTSAVALLETRIMEHVNSNAPEIAVIHSFTSDSIPVRIPGFLSSPIHIQYIVMERLGATLEQFIPEAYGGRIPLNLASRLAIRLIELVRRLHELGINHGDLHFGNIAVRPDSGLVLIDFGRSRFMSELREHHAPTNQVLCHPLMSPWETRGQPIGYRDDVFRVVQIMASLVHGSEYDDMLTEMCSGPYRTNQDMRRYLELKTVGNVFHSAMSATVSHGRTVRRIYPVGGILGLSNEWSERAEHLFANVLQIVRASTSPLDSPNYDLIIECLRELEAIPTKPLQRRRSFDFLYTALSLN